MATEIEKKVLERYNTEVTARKPRQRNCSFVALLDDGSIKTDLT